MRLVRTQNPNFHRDEDTNALINTNVTAFKSYKQQRQDRQKVDSMQKEIDDLKNLVQLLLKDKDVKIDR